MARQYLIPGVGYINETGSREYLLPGAASAYIRETVAAGPGAQTVVPTSIASAEAFGTVTIRCRVFPSSIASAEAFGSVTIKCRVSPGSIASAEAFGSVTIKCRVFPGSIASAGAFGAVAVKCRIYPSSIASSEAFGSVVVSGGTVLVQTIDLAGRGAQFGGGRFGVPQFGGQAAQSISSREAVSSPGMNLRITMVSIASAGAFGSAVISIKLTSQPVGHLSVAAVPSGRISVVAAPSGRLVRA